MNRLTGVILFSATFYWSLAGWSQFANVYEIQAAALGEVNFQVYELNLEKKSRAALEIVVKALGNLEKQKSPIPNLNSSSVFEISFDDMISSKQKQKISAGEIFNFQRLPENSRLQVLTALETKYSAAVFDMALQMRRFHLHHAYALRSILKTASASAVAGLENVTIEEISKSLSMPFLLKNSASGITYVFDFADLLSASISKTSLSTEYASINSRLVELFVEIATESKGQDFAALRNSKRPNALTYRLNSNIQFKKAEYFRAVMATEGNKLYVQ